MIHQYFRYFLFVSLAISGLLLSSCEDAIDVDSGFEEPKLVVDGWINTRNEPQTIRLSWSQDYFDAAKPAAITDATVALRNGERILSFLHAGDGAYVWTPIGEETIGTTGDVIELGIDHPSGQFVSQTTVRRVPVIDSISMVFEEESLGVEEGFYGEVYAKDFPGQGDSYWIRAWKNDSLLNKPQELTIVWDATFDPGSGLDGVAFIRPLRLSINPQSDEGGFDPYQTGDRAYVEVHSISNEAFYFLQIAQEQMTNGDNAIFSLPIANARSNIINVQTNESVLGFFNVANISSAERWVD